MFIPTCYFHWRAYKTIIYLGDAPSNSQYSAESTKVMSDKAKCQQGQYLIAAPIDKKALKEQVIHLFKPSLKQNYDLLSFDL